ncbi:MAG: M1 family peptidase, partial [Bacteroidota bacterium]
MKYIARTSFILCISSFIFQQGSSQPLNQKEKFTRQDTLRGSITPERAWWNVVFYNINVTPDYKAKTISAWNQIGFDVNT